MKKKYLILCSLFVVALCFTFCFYKIYLLNKFPILGKGEIKEIISDLEEMQIETDRQLANTKFHDMNIYIPEDMINNTPDYLDSNHITFSHKTDSSFAIYLFKSITWYKSLDKPYKGISSEDSRAILESYGIAGDLDMIDYYKDRVGSNNNIFTSKSRIIADHLAAQYIYDTFVIRDSDTDPYVFTGDLKGSIGHVNEYLSIAHIYSDKDDSIVYEIWIDGMEVDKTKILESIYFE